jgi:hypothetical protein
MTALCHPIPSTPMMRGAAGDVATKLDVSLTEAAFNTLGPRVAEMLSSVHALCDQRLTDSSTAAKAVTFALQLPRSLPAPEISADPDGEISFDWFGPSGKMYSISINQSGRLSYAGWFREDSRVHGTETLADAAPEQILRGIARATT